jgi:threonine synthase
MEIQWAPEEIRENIIPNTSGDVVYQCGTCGDAFPYNRVLYVCPSCGGLLSVIDRDQDRLSLRSPGYWRDMFTVRPMTNRRELSGVFCFHEFLAPCIPMDSIVYLGEGNTPLVLSEILSEEHGVNVYVKLDGLNPTASFKDRGMACALSHTNHLMRTKVLGKDVMTVCASTGDTSAAAALYAAAAGSRVKSVVLLPQGLVTSQQLAQPLGAGATVFELPGVFDDCMKVVEALSQNFDVVLLNSKNPWRLLGQESYAFEVARQLDYSLGNASVFLPVGNAGNMTAVLSGFLKLFRAGVLSSLPRMVAVQSAKADPLAKYLQSQEDGERVFEMVSVKPSVAQAAMIGNPVSFPRLNKLYREYVRIMGKESFEVVEVGESQIMESMLKANQSGLPICTQGGECLAAFQTLSGKGLFKPSDVAILDSTAHFLKFTEFQNAYYEDRLKDNYGVISKEEYKNVPKSLKLSGVKTPGKGASLSASEYQDYVKRAADEIAELMGMESKG